MNLASVQLQRSQGRDFGAQLTRDIDACRRFTDNWAVVHWAHCANVSALFTELTSVITKTDYPIVVLPSSGLLRLYGNGACTFSLERLSNVELDLVRQPRAFPSLRAAYLSGGCQVARGLKQSNVANALPVNFTREAYRAINLRNVVFAVLLSVEDMLVRRGTELRSTTFAFESCSVLSRYVAADASRQVSGKRDILVAYSLLHAAILRTRGTVEMAVLDLSEKNA